MTIDEGDRDEAWFDRLYREWHGAVLAYARRRVSDPDDLVSDVFSAAWRHRDRVSDPPLLWLLRTASNYCLHAARTNRRRLRLTARIATLEQPYAVARDASDEIVSQILAADLIRSALDRLPIGDQEILRLAEWESLPTSDLAYVMECSQAAARVRLHRARARLAREVRRMQPDPLSNPKAVEVTP